MAEWTTLPIKKETKEGLDKPDGVSWDYWIRQLAENDNA